MKQKHWPGQRRFVRLPSGLGYDVRLGSATFQKVCNNFSVASDANVIADQCFIDFDIPVGAKSALCHLLCWVTG